MRDLRTKLGLILPDEGSRDYLSSSLAKIVLSSKIFLGQNTCNSIRNYLSSSLYSLSLSREISSSFLFTSKKGLRDRGSLVVKDS